MKRALLVVVGLVAFLLMAVPAGFSDEEYDTARAKIENTRIPNIDFEEEDLETVIEFCQTVTGLNFVVSPEVVEEDIKITLALNEVTVRQILRLIVRLKNLRIYYVDGVIMVDVEGTHRETPSMRMYDIRALQVEVKDFPGPEISLVADDDGAPSITMNFDDGDDSQLDTEQIVEMITDFTGGTSWDDDERASITIFGGMLIVVQSSEVHREIVWLLAMLEGLR